MSITSPPLVSVVTPVYNGAEHLAECMESILAQTYQAWECLIVDNCSTDGTAEIARRYAAKDPRIRLYQNQRFLQALPNHSAALRRISPMSKYCKVVFADDWIFPECLDRMVAVAEAHPSVGLVSAYCLKGRQVTLTGLPYPSTVVSGVEICRRHFLDELYVFGSATCVLYRADLVRARDPFYDDRNIHADTEACFALLESSDFGFVHQVLSFSRIRAGSLNTISASLNTDYAGMSHLLVMHGRSCLTEKEFQTRMDRHLRDYYRFLGKSLFVGRNKEFWKYHKTHLIQTGLGFSRARLVRATLGNVCRKSLSARSSVEQMFTARKQRRLAERG